MDKQVVRLYIDSSIEKFFWARYVLRCKVSVRKYRSTGVTQCYNCQRYGHVSFNFRMLCVECGSSHWLTNCNILPREYNILNTVSKDPFTGQVSKRLGMILHCVAWKGMLQVLWIVRREENFCLSWRRKNWAGVHPSLFCDQRALVC